MSSDIHAQPAELLNQPPNFRPARPDLVGNFRAADDNGSVAHEQADDAAQANICRLVYGRQAASFRGGGDGGNYSESLVVEAVVSRWSLANETVGDPVPRTTDDQRLTTGFYAGVTRRLISTAVDDCVSAP